MREPLKIVNSCVILGIFNIKKMRDHLKIHVLNENGTRKINCPNKKIGQLKRIKGV